MLGCGSGGGDGGGDGPDASCASILELGEPTLIAQSLAGFPGALSDIEVVDVEGDGDPDVVIAAFRENTVTWYENLDGLGAFSADRFVTAPDALDFGVVDIDAADLDGDGDADLLVANPSGFSVSYVNDGAGAFARASTLFNGSGVSAVDAADIDGDGDLDALIGQGFDSAQGGVYLSRNQEGTFAFNGALQIASAPTTEHVTAADLDGDGDLDVVSSTSGLPPALGAIDSELSWHENMGDSFVTRTLVSEPSTDVNSGFSKPVAADLDGDGDRDLVYTAFRMGTRWQRNDGTGAFEPALTIDDDRSNGPVVDLDGDGDLDVIVAGPGDIVWRQNTGATTFDPQLLHSTNGQEFPALVSTADIDGDGDLDIVAAFYLLRDGHRLTWIENLGVRSTCD